jgi:AraC-like DNA-binding protein
MDVAKRWHVRSEDLLAEVSLSENLDNPFERLPVATMCLLLERARSLMGEPGLGYHLGLQTRTTLYGYLGFAALSASSVREALGLVVQFAPMFSTALAIDLRIEGRVAALYLKEHVDLGAARDVVLIHTMVGLREMGQALTGRELNGSADFAFPEPDCHARFAELAPYARFGQPVNRLVFDVAILDYPILMADRAALDLARKVCERELNMLGAGTTLAERVRRLIACDDGGFRSLEQVAERVALSPRTLRRQLASEGILFSVLVDRERCDMALRLLKSSRLRIEHVAKRLEFSNVSSFVRAFHRWTGKTPTAYRREIWQ